MSKKFPIQPSHPERVCWGCDRFCSATSMMCGNGSVRTPHPMELFGEDWHEWTPPDASRPAAGEPANEPADGPANGQAAIAAD